MARPSRINGRAGAAFVFLATLGWSMAASSAPPVRSGAANLDAQENRKGQAVTTFDRQLGLGEPTPVSIAGQRLAPAPFAALPRAPAPADGFKGPLGDTGFTARSPGELQPKPWRESAVFPVDPSLPPQFVGSQGARILVQGSGRWSLVDPAGQHIASGRTLGGPVFLVNGTHFIYPDTNSQLVSGRQSDGAIEFMYPIAFGDLFSKPLLAQIGNRVIVASVEQEGLPHRPHPPSLSAVELIQIGQPLTVLADKLLTSVEHAEKLLISNPRMVIAFGGPAIVLAIPNRIVRLGPDLKVLAAFDGSFEPRRISVDETGRAYLLVDDENRAGALWVVSDDGKRLVATPLAENIGLLLAPPIVGLDHQIFVVGDNVLIAFSPSGEKLWRAKPQFGFAGATITSNGWVLASDGSEIVGFNPKGEREVLARLPNALNTPPVLLANGRLLAATKDKLYIFRQ